MSHGGMSEQTGTDYYEKLRRDISIWDATERTGAEMHRQLAKWGEQNHESYLNYDVIQVLESAADLDIAGSLTEYAKTICDKRLGMGTCSWQDILNEEVMEARDEAIAGNTEALKVELIQIAAVALSWYLSVERNGR